MNQYEKQMLWCFGGGSPAIRYTRYTLLSGLLVHCFLWIWARAVRMLQGG